ncbi:glycosyltransferase family protein [Enterococcus durans]|uniref:glycosyltransferase family 4 protein n=1 Tax=Enterococcus durans TaxID=53345 RepID=UPI0011594252|nr:glycosyltransferase family 4 protein [Enterococcus durans]MCG3447933.1 hypothetical protein [Enterococcus durans]
MKKHLTFIVNDFLPFPSANGICVDNIVRELLGKWDLDVTVISLKSESSQKKFEQIDNISIYRFESNERKIRNKLKKYDIGVKRNTWLKIIKIRKYIKDILNPKTYDKDLTKHLKDNIIRVNQIKKIDYIFPVCFPFESIIASKEIYKDLKIPYIPILFDKYSSSNTLHRNKINKKIKFKNNLKFEKENIKYSRKVIASYDWKNHILTNWNFQKEFIIYGYPPALKKINYTTIDNNAFKGTFIFAGSVNKNIRPVKFIIDFFKRLFEEQPEFHLDFYTQGNEKKKLDYFSKLFPRQVTSHSIVSKEKINKFMEDTNILISIGNTDVSQTPSKIFEYIGLNKPIVHFYKKNNDPVISILNEYEKGISISQDYSELESSIVEMNEFIKKVKVNSFDKKSISNLYEATPEYYGEVINSLIDDKLIEQI